MPVKVTVGAMVPPQACEEGGKMEKQWAVACMDFYNSEMSIVVVRSNSWHGAMQQHPMLAGTDVTLDYTTQETAKQTAFDLDMVVGVVEIPNV